MASGWQTRLTRLSQMSWDEVRTRVQQEVYKRVDAGLWRIGARSTGTKLADRQSTAHFFFDGDEARQRAECVRAYLPSEAEQILREADDICRHRFRLLGYDGLDYGNEIDWHVDRVHGKRAPLKPWFQIPFLNFEVVGDHKVTWELNRHQHLVTLAKAWLLSGEERYVSGLIKQWRSWTVANPYPLGINWGSTLEVAFRSLSWIWVDQLLATGERRPTLKDGSEVAEFRSDLIQGLALHGRYIERFLSTYFSPNTHLLGEAVALFFLGTLYPQIPRAARWQETGRKTILREAERQVRADGVYFEQSLYYHIYALDFFLHARILAARNGVGTPAAFDDVLRRMLTVVETLSQAGAAEGFGDDDGGRVFNSRRNRTGHMTDPLALGASLYGREACLTARLTEESVWLFGQQAIDSCAPATTEAPNDLRSTAFPDGGLYVLADRDPFRQQLVVDAGPQGVGRSGHGHADALSLRLTIHGQRWLVDAGSGVYISADGSERDSFRGTAAHNTLLVDRVDQAIPDGPFAWASIPTVQAESWVAGKSFTYFVGSHDGYARLADPVIHQRHVLKINRGPCLVRDVAIGREEHGLEVLWHFASDLEVRETAPRSFAVTRSDDTTSSGSSLTVIPLDDSRWRVDITEGVLSPAYGLTESAPVIRCRAHATLPAEVAVALLPRTGAFEPDPEQRLIAERRPAAQAYELLRGAESRAFCFALDKRPWTHGPWSSDAELLHAHFAGDQLLHLIVVRGSYVAWRGRELLKSSTPSGVFEWRLPDGVLAGQGSFNTSPLLAELTGSPVGSGVSSGYAEKK